MINAMIDPEARIQACGKELLLDDRHLADCTDPHAALVLAICLNKSGTERMTPAEVQIVAEFFA